MQISRLNFLKKTLRVISIIILLLATLSVYSNLVFEAAKKGKESGIIAKHLTNFANYPNLVMEVLNSNELAGVPSSFVKSDTTFNNTNKLSYDLFALNSFWDIQKKEWNVKLFNLKNDSTAYKWVIPSNILDFSTTHYQIENSIPANGLVLSDKSLIVKLNYTSNLMRLNANSKVMWKNNDLMSSLMFLLIEKVTCNFRGKSTFRSNYFYWT